MSARKSDTDNTEDKRRNNYPVVVLVSAAVAFVGVVALLGIYIGGASGTVPPTPSTVRTRLPASPRASARPPLNPPNIGVDVPAPPRGTAIGGTQETDTSSSGASEADSSAENAVNSTPEPTPPGSEADGSDTPADSVVYGAEQQIYPIKVSASAHAPPGFDSQGNPTTFEPHNVIDGVETTAWRIPGTGVGDFLLLEFAAPTLVSRIGLIPGYAKTDFYDGTDRFLQNRRVRRVVIEFSNGAMTRATFDDERRMQYKALSAPVETTFIRITIEETTEHGGRDFAAISEIIVIGRERVR